MPCYSQGITWQGHFYLVSIVPVGTTHVCLVIFSLQTRKLISCFLITRLSWEYHVILLSDILLIFVWFMNILFSLQTCMTYLVFSNMRLSRDGYLTCRWQLSAKILEKICNVFRRWDNHVSVTSFAHWSGALLCNKHH